MSGPKQRGSQQWVEEIVGNLLRGGVILAAVVVLAGGISFLIRHGATIPDYRVFQGEPADLYSVSGIIINVVELRSRGIIQFGLLLLIATPVARVAFSAVAFALERDRLYIVVTLIVLTVLLYSLVGGYR